ncbi:PorV/PorQ family protein, partial [bacterium]|nr:PorV/PorQ family protein [bacterium]
MSFKYRMRLFAVLILVVSGNSVAFGSIGADMLRMEVPANPAALAAGAANRGGSEMLAWNPAGILGQTIPSCSFTHFFSLADTAYEQLEGLYPQWLNGSCAFRIFYASTYNFVERDLQGNDRGTVNNHDLLLHLAYARAWDPAWNVGAALKLFEGVLAGYDSQGFGIDLGAQYKIPQFPSLVLGLALQNIGLMNAWDREAEALPMLAVIGAAFTRPLLSDHQVKLLLDINQLLTGAKPPLVSLGLEYNLKNILCLRSGYRLENELGTLSLGAGVSYANFGLDYAFQPFGILGNNHRFTLSFYLRPAVPASDYARKIQKPRLKSAKLEPSEKDLKELRVASRNIENTIKFKLPHINPDIRGWNFEVRDCDGRLVKKMQGLHTPPKELLYNGLDQNGNPLPREGKYLFIFTAAGKKIFTRETPQLEPVKKLCFKDRAVLAPEVRFVFQTR